MPVQAVLMHRHRECMWFERPFTKPFEPLLVSNGESYTTAYTTCSEAVHCESNSLLVDK